MTKKSQVTTIYRLINHYDNGRCYVGATRQTLANRLNDHKGEARQKRSTAPIHQAIRIWGFDAFTVEVLATAKDEDYAKNVLEPHFIKKYDAFTRGYNATTGGPGIPGNKRPAEAIKKTVLAKMLHNPECMKIGGRKRRGMVSFTDGQRIVWRKKGQPAPKGFVPGLPFSKSAQALLKKVA